MEKAFVFGEKKNLIGILSQPGVPVDGQDKSSEDKPLVLILNSGFVHRPGPFRMNREFSMFLADNGYSSFRFDLSGVGDSEKQAMDSMVYKERNLSDIGEALAFINDTVKPRRIVVMGLCTGADLAHKAAVKYSEISGTVSLDGYGYPTSRFYLKRYGPVLLDPMRMFRIFSRLLLQFIPGAGSGEVSESGADAYYWVLPDKKDYIADMENMHRAGKKHFYAYTGGVAEYYNYESQFADAFQSCAFKDGVQVSCFHYSDHTYILLSQRKQLFDKILKWLDVF
ncbi:MAG TPA: hypothetical protein ENJ08_10585 [Gammaproteobacteria bacterium]|nr:hypothetical protein [Gammaproteobacteria bacterium]